MPRQARSKSPRQEQEKKTTITTPKSTTTQKSSGGGRKPSRAKNTSTKKPKRSARIVEEEEEEDVEVEEEEFADVISDDAILMDAEEAREFLAKLDSKERVILGVCRVVYVFYWILGISCLLFPGNVGDHLLDILLDANVSDTGVRYIGVAFVALGCAFVPIARSHFHTMIMGLRYNMIANFALAIVGVWSSTEETDPHEKKLKVGVAALGLFLASIEVFAVYLHIPMKSLAHAD